MRRIKKKVQRTFFPSNRPTKPLCGEETLNPGFKELLATENKKTQTITRLSLFVFNAEDGT